MLRLEIAARSEVGARRRNEDDLRFGQAEASCYLVLADGAGGHRDGALASRWVVQTIALQMQALAQAAGQATPALLSAWVHAAHAALGEQQLGEVDRERMHATVVLLWIDAADELALWSHVGDSRLYMLRRGRVCHVTHDDTVVQQMLDAGFLTADEARRHPSKHQLATALGVTGAVDPHTVDEAQAIEDGDAFLLCSDGWWETLEASSIEDMFAAASNAADWLDRMAREVESAARASQDNFSAVAVWIGDPAQTTRFGPL
jgi:PPM family protein phosphatase